MAVSHWGESTPSCSTTSTTTRGLHPWRMRSAQRHGYLPEIHCCITGRSAKTTTTLTVPRTSKCLCLGVGMKRATIPSIKATGTGMITGMGTTIMRREAPTLMTIHTIIHTTIHTIIHTIITIDGQSVAGKAEAAT
jgi:hypothetical protein